MYDLGSVCDIYIGLVSPMRYLLYDNIGIGWAPAMHALGSVCDNIRQWPVNIHEEIEFF